MSSRSLICFFNKEKDYSQRTRRLNMVCIFCISCTRNSGPHCPIPYFYVYTLYNYWNLIFYVVSHHNNVGVCGMFKLSTFSTIVLSHENVLKDIYTCLAFNRFPWSSPSGKNTRLLLKSHHGEFMSKFITSVCTYNPQFSPQPQNLMWESYWYTLKECL